MSEPLPKATHTGILRIGEIELECHVLEDGTRLFSSRDLLKAFGLENVQKDQPRVLRSFLERIELISIGNDELTNPLAKPIKFIRKGKGGIQVNGYSVELLPEMCNAVLKLSTDHWLKENMRDAAKRSRKLMNAFAKVGVIALVDEATGYQEVRDKKALQEILDRYLASEYSAWAKRFPDTFYKEMFRLRGWEWLGMQLNRPSCVGTYTNDIVYNRLAPGILDELRRLNPPDENGQRRVRHHQWLTDDIGHPALNDHLSGVLALMRASNDWAQFKRMLTRVYPKYGEQGLLPIDED